MSPLVSDRSLRWRRTPLIGSIDWPGALPVLGPWGGLRAVPLPSSADDAAPHPSLELVPRALRTRVGEDGSGVVTVQLGGVAGTTPDLGADTDGSAGAASVAANTGGSADVGVPTEPGAGAEDARDTVHITVEPPCEVDAQPVTAERVVTASDLTPHGVLSVDVTVPDPALWWPYGMGEQPLYGVRVRTGQGEYTYTVGFRSVRAEPRDRDHRGLALRINDVPVFARGAVWAGADPFEVAADPQRTRDVLERLHAGGSTMIRVPGTACYETEDFHRACDELGLMVWQDVALGPQDPPDDPEWCAGLRHEVRYLASRLASHPSTVVISGGTEVIQAPALAGRPAEQWRTDVVLRDVPRAVGEADADVVVVPSSPCSDADLDAAQHAYETGEASGEQASSSVPTIAPTDAVDGVSHYFGVGAYGRPLEDAVTRGVRFAAEALAFAVPPEPAAVREQFGTDGPLDDADSAEAWRAGVAHDPGAEWTFEDTTAVYVHRLFLDRDSDPDAGLATPAQPASDGAGTGHAEHLEYERAALAHVFQRTFAQWRSGHSPCRGALVLSALSTAAGPGWGVLDVSGRPTAAWYGMRRACAPVAVSFLPAGGDGLPVHVWNDGPTPLTTTLRLTVVTVRGGCQQPLDIPVTVPARGDTVVRADLADGTFRDLDHAYGFGEREYDAVSALLVDPSGRVLARDVHLTGGPRRNDAPDPGLDARWVRTEQGEWAVAVTASGLARFVALDLPGGAEAEDGYGHVLPGETVHVPVSGTLTDEGRAATRVRALGVPSVPVNAESG
nr:MULTISPECIES: glycoside hydrolase family 2 protein [Kocuria]